MIVKVTAMNGEDGNFQNLGGFGWIIMQYTGLKDKNGKEIYEGDIVEYSRNFPPILVEWDDNIVGFKPFCKYDSDCYGVPKKEDHSVYKIIGNVYENPELLK